MTTRESDPSLSVLSRFKRLVTGIDTSERPIAPLPPD